MIAEYGLLGRTLGHSWSPQIHGLLASYDYRLHEIEPQSLASFLQKTSLAGMNVTIPYKKDVLPFCAELSDAAQSIGSVNTLVRRKNGWYGDNTDYAGFIAMAKSCGVSLKGRKTLVFGTGGASLAVRAALRDLGAEPVVSVSRTGADSYDNLNRHYDAEVLVNTTPLGMYPNTGVSPVELCLFPACRAVLDVVYNPLRTKLLLDAAALGIPCAGGLTMLVAQARRSAELFTQTAIADERVGEIVSILERQMQNIVLIGMPGCGKSTVGKALAAALDRPFIDADEQIEKAVGMTVPEIFAAEGEAGFRKRETAVLSEFGKRSGLVLATGGGCVTSAENDSLLRQNGVIIWIQRKLENLATGGRPLSQTTAMETMFQTRERLYQAFSDHIVVSDERIPHTVSAILEMIS